jgi:demethylmenaquinone methyltransferase/2-methoxy-6-polyprenyl-1,4-benzoquinol methylase
MRATGARPAGSQDEAGAAQAVRQMFDSIAPRYDRLNHVLSASVDRLWWWQTARRFKAILADPDAAVLDICCGTGHMTRALLRGRPKGSRPILAADFAREMLARGARQFAPPSETDRRFPDHPARPSLTPFPSRPMRCTCRCGRLRKT